MWPQYRQNAPLSCSSRLTFRNFIATTLLRLRSRLTTPTQHTVAFISHRAGAPDTEEPDDEDGPLYPAAAVGCPRRRHPWLLARERRPGRPPRARRRTADRRGPGRQARRAARRRDGTRHGRASVEAPGDDLGESLGDDPEGPRPAGRSRAEGR